jgi:spermidine/putrescine transport system permease protein
VGKGDGEALVRRRESWRGLAYAGPALGWTALFFLLPLGVIAVWSLYRREGTKLVTDWSLANYERFFGDAALLSALPKSLWIAAQTTVVSVLVAYPVAYVLAVKVPARWQRLALVLAVLPFWTSYVVRSYSWLLVLAPDGIVNGALLRLGLVSEPLKLSFTSGATVLGFVHFFMMLCTLTIFASLVRLDPRLKLAAADLGASRWQTFWRVTWPLSLPGVAAGAFLTFVIAIGDYVTPQILGGNMEMLLPQAIMFQMGRRGDIPMAAALSLVLMAVITVAYLVASRRVRVTP